MIQHIEPHQLQLPLFGEDSNDLDYKRVVPCVGRRNIMEYNNLSDVINYFHWFSTPEGDSYWRSVYDKILGYEDLGFIRYEPRWLREGGLVYALISAFSFAATSEGTIYWHEVTEKLRHIDYELRKKGYLPEINS